MTFAHLPAHLARAVRNAPGLARHLEGHDLSVVDSLEALAELPVLRKPALMEAQAAHPPFGGFVHEEALEGARIFLSPGPVWEPQGAGSDPWNGARALEAAGFHAGDRVHNALGYHFTPGGLILDTAARALGCTVFPAGIGNTQAQVEAIAAYRPVAYTGTPDYLQTILDRADEMGADMSSILRAMVSGGALFPAMREAYAERGIQVMQCYATADLGVIAYETRTGETLDDGMLVNQNLILEIVRPGTDDPVPEEEVGEVVVTALNETYPLVRFGTGDLSRLLPGGTRIAGWMGRADQRTKVKGMFVDPAQVNAVSKAHGLAKARLVVTRDGTSDTMTLEVEGKGDADPIAATLREQTKLGGAVTFVDELPNDGMVIVDRRDYET